MPAWADAEHVVAGFTPKEGVHYTALWFNASGLNRALVFRNKLTITGSHNAVVRTMAQAAAPGEP